MIAREVRTITEDRQASLFDISAYESDRGTDFDYDWENDRTLDNRTQKFSVPNSRSSGDRLENLPDPSTDEKLGTKNFLVPNFDEWKPPIGCLQKKWIKNDYYWYWRYYDNRLKKASMYLGRDYNKAVRKCQKIGVPPDAKPPKTSLKNRPET